MVSSACHYFCSGYKVEYCNMSKFLSDIKSPLILTLTVLLTGQTDGSDVRQNDTIWRNQGDSATIDCTHTKSIDYSQMYWYRQLPGETMKLIVFTRSGIENHDFEPDFKNERFKTTKPDAFTGTFTVKNLVPQDKGLYLCAVSKHSDTHSCES